MNQTLLLIFLSQSILFYQSIINLVKTFLVPNSFQLVFIKAWSWALHFYIRDADMISCHSDKRWSLGALERVHFRVCRVPTWPSESVQLFLNLF